MSKVSHAARRSWSGAVTRRVPVGHNKLKLLAQLDYKQAAPGTGGARPLPPGILIKDSKCCSGKNRRDHAAQVRFRFCF